MAKAKTKQTGLSALGSLSFKGELVLGALVAELIGTFVLTFAILNATGNIIIVALSVLVLSLALAKLSGGHVNPATTVALAATKQISVVKAVGYLVAQFLGAMLAVVIATHFMNAEAVANSGAKVFTLFGPDRPAGHWKPFFGELVGAIIFGFGVASTYLGKKEGYDAAFTIGGSLLIGLLIATAGSYAVLNPAVALGLGGYAQGGWWSISAYGLAPLIGAAAGAWLYKLLQTDVDNAVSA